LKTFLSLSKQSSENLRDFIQPTGEHVLSPGHQVWIVSQVVHWIGSGRLQEEGRLVCREQVVTSAGIPGDELSHDLNVAVLEVAATLIKEFLIRGASSVEKDLNSSELSKKIIDFIKLFS